MQNLEEPQNPPMRISQQKETELPGSREAHASLVENPRRQSLLGRRRPPARRRPPPLVPRMAGTTTSRFFFTNAQSCAIVYARFPGGIRGPERTVFHVVGSCTGISISCNSYCFAGRWSASPDQERQGDGMRIGFVGAGKAGCSLGRFFAGGGVPVTGYYSRHQGSAREAAEFTNSRFYDTLEELAGDSDALLLTVPDGAVTPVFQELAGYGMTGKQICHCSGAMTAGEAFPGIAGTGAYGYSIHPLFPFSDRLKCYRELPGAFFCIEGQGPHLEAWRALLEGLGAEVQVLAPEAKARYHAACSIASNLVCALVQESVELLEDCGFSGETALRALTPLIRSNTAHILERGPIEALTGPVERGDLGTVEKHLACLPEEAGALYRAVSRKLADMAARKHPEGDYTALERLLKEG